MSKRNAWVRPELWYRAWKVTSALAKYPAYAPPHLHNEIGLSPDEARENFDYFLERRAFRLQVLSEFMRKFGIDATTNDSGLAAVSNWFDRYAGLLLTFRPRTSTTFLAFLDHEPPWTGEHIGINAVWDLGIYVGECIIARRPSAHWELDTGGPDPVSCEAVGYQRPCVAGLYWPTECDPITQIFMDANYMCARMRIGQGTFFLRGKLMQHVVVWSRPNAANPSLEKRTY